VWFAHGSRTDQEKAKPRERYRQCLVARGGIDCMRSSLDSGPVSSRPRQPSGPSLTGFAITGITMIITGTSQVLHSTAPAASPPSATR
jgi:hypothetical protein